MFFSILIAFVLIFCAENAAPQQHSLIPLTFKVAEQSVMITSEDKREITFVLPAEAKIFAYDDGTVCVVPKGFKGLLLIRRNIMLEDDHDWLLITVTPAESLKNMGVSLVPTDAKKLQKEIKDLSASR